MGKRQEKILVNKYKSPGNKQKMCDLSKNERYS